MSRLRTALAGLALLLLGACAETPLVVGAKQSPADQIVAEMVALLAEDAGIDVERRIGLGSTRLMLAVMQRGELDIYPEYTGTGLAMVGLPPTRDPAAAHEQVTRRFAPLQLTWSAPLGFRNDYALAMLGDRARALGIETYSDLVGHADRLTLGTGEEFTERPVDGLEPLLRRYGMRFADIVTVPTADRLELYDGLIERRLDIVVAHETDGQIADFGLRLLEDDLGFFPAYEAALLIRDAALERFTALPDLIDQLTGRLDLATMRRLTTRVTQRGEDPRVVAQTELTAMGLLDGETRQPARQRLAIAISPSAKADGEAVAVLRALHRSFPNRNVALSPFLDPLAAVAAGKARVALVGAPAFFAPGAVDPATGQPPLREGFEAVALVGTSYLHAFALDPTLVDLRDATRIATGAVGSTGHRAAQSLIDGLDLAAEIVTVAATDADAFADALLASGAEAAVLMQPLDNWTVLALLENGNRLLSVDGWSESSNRLAFPYLAPARLTAADYASLEAPIETLVAQLVLAAPAHPPADRIGNQGPAAAFEPLALPLTDQAVRQINDALAETGQINPILPRAPALEPDLPRPAAALNPAPDVSILTILVLVMLAWMGWLLVRPEHR